MEERIEYLLSKDCLMPSPTCSPSVPATFEKYCQHIVNLVKHIVPVLKKAIESNHSPHNEKRLLKFHIDQLRVLSARCWATVHGKPGKVKSDILNGYMYSVPGYPLTRKGCDECFLQVQVATSCNKRDWEGLLTKKYSRRARSPCRNWNFVVNDASKHYQSLKLLSNL